MSKMITVEEAANETGLNAQVIRRILRDKRFTGFIKCGKHYYINAELFEEFLRGELSAS